jgi:hypothetical protein
VKLPTAVLLVTLLTSGASLAADYSVEFGAETPAGKDAGTLDCRLDQVCYAKMPSLGLTVSLDVSRSDPTEANVGFYGGDLSCCYFGNDRDTITVYSREPLSPIPFFKGAGARGNLFIEHERAGTLYLRFHFRKDDIINRKAGHLDGNYRTKTWRPLIRSIERVIVHPEDSDSENL